VDPAPDGPVADVNRAEVEEAASIIDEVDNIDIALRHIDEARHTVRVNTDRGASNCAEFEVRGHEMVAFLRAARQARVNRLTQLGVAGDIGRGA
jgi:hypothetical protein